jgi:DmsE family decaheme c-type cytochrome
MLRLRLHGWLATGLLFLAPLGVHDATAATSTSAEEEPVPQLSRKGADDCLRCHDDKQILTIFRTPHGSRVNPRSPFTGLQCEACHGPGSLHIQSQRRGEGKILPPVVFGSNTKTPVNMQNQACLQCHESDARIGWKGSVHERNDLSCSNCHKVHETHDPALNKSEQGELCFGCHLEQRAEIFRAFTHGQRFDALSCSDCHNPHSSPGAHLLIKPTVNQTCYTCHADLRGPFLWEHPPAAENCDFCHTPHGSTNQALLKQQPPLLCQRCHSQAGHPSVAYTGTGLPPSGAERALLAQSCLNCHSQVHGSNHPSGVNLLR